MLAGKKADPTITLGEGKGETQKILAKKADVSHGTLDKIEAIIKKATPEVIKHVEDGDISINRAYIETVAPERERPQKRPGKQLQFEDIIKRTAQLMDKVVSALTELVEHKELFADPQYVETFERWEFNLVTEQLLSLLEKLGAIQGGEDNAETRPKQDRLTE